MGLEHDMTRKAKLRLIVTASLIAVVVVGLWLLYHLHGLNINEAARANDVTGVKLLLMLGKNPNQPDHSFCIGGTPLLTAAAMASPEVMNALLDAGADVKARNSDGETPLHLAASMPAYRPAFPTSEHMPSRQDYRIMTRMLVDAGSDVNARTKDGWTPLCMANDRLVVRYLLANGADPTIVGRASKETVWVPCRPDVAQKLAKGQVSVKTATLYDRPDLLAAHLSGKADVNARLKELGMSPLRYAVLAQSPNVVKWLLSNGADIKADPDLLHCAVAQGDFEMVRLLIYKGADVNGKDGRGVTPIAIATDSDAFRGSTYCGPWYQWGEEEPGSTKAASRIMCMLAEHGADVNVTICTCGQCDAETPLQWAQRNDDQKLIAVLRKHGAKN